MIRLSDLINLGISAKGFRGFKATYRYKGDDFLSGIIESAGYGTARISQHSIPYEHIYLKELSITHLELLINTLTKQLNVFKEYKNYAKQNDLKKVDVNALQNKRLLKIIKKAKDTQSDEFLTELRMNLLADLE